MKRDRLEKDRLESPVVANSAFANYSQLNLVEIIQTHYHPKFQQTQTKIIDVSGRIEPICN